MNVNENNYEYNQEHLQELSHLNITEFSPDINTLCVDKILFEQYHSEFPIVKYIERHLERGDIDFDPFKFFNCELLHQLKLEIWSAFVLGDKHNYLKDNLEIIVKDLYNEDITKRSLKSLLVALKQFIDNPNGLELESPKILCECITYITPCLKQIMRRELTGKGRKKKQKYTIKKTKKRKNRNKKSKKICK